MLSRKNHNKLPPLLKCVVCQHRPADMMHHHIPICKSCKAVLDKHINRDGGLIIQYLDALRTADSSLEIASLSERIIEHASKLVPYEDLNLKTIEPTPTVIIHRMRSQEYTDLFPELFSEDDGATGSPKHRRPLRYALFLGVVVAVVVAGVGVVNLWQKPGVQPSSNGSTSKETKVTQPLEAVSTHWRAVIMQPLLKQGPYYNILLYYRGSKSMPSIGHVIVNWNGNIAVSETDFNGKPIQPGEQVGTIENTAFPHGIADAPPIQVNWTEQGKKYTETIPLSDAKNSIQISGQDTYSGRDAQWQVSYKYEALKGKGFSDSFAVFVLTRKGQPIGNVDCIINSSTGAQDFSVQDSDTNTTRVDFHPAQSGYHLTGNQAQMTIEWSTGTDVIVLNKSR